MVSIEFTSLLWTELTTSRIFLIEGVITIALAIIAYLSIVPLPEDAKFLTAEEKSFVLWRLQSDDISSGKIGTNC